MRVKPSLICLFYRLWGDSGQHSLHYPDLHIQVWCCAVHSASGCVEAATPRCAVCSPAAWVEDICDTEDGLRQPQQGCTSDGLWRSLPSFFISILLSSQSCKIYLPSKQSNAFLCADQFKLKLKFKVMTLNLCYSSSCSIFRHAAWPSLLGSQKTTSIQNMTVFFAGSLSKYAASFMNRSSSSVFFFPT